MQQRIVDSVLLISYILQPRLDQDIFIQSLIIVIKQILVLKRFGLAN